MAGVTRSAKEGVLRDAGVDRRDVVAFLHTIETTGGGNRG